MRISCDILSVLWNISSGSDILSAALLDQLQAHVAKGDIGSLWTVTNIQGMSPQRIDKLSAMLDPYSADVLWIVIVSFAVGFILAFGIGANSVPNSFATSIGSKVLTIRQACCIGTVFEIAGSMLLGECNTWSVHNEAPIWVFFWGSGPEH